MNSSSFISGLVITILICLGLYFGLIQLYPQFAYTDLNIMSIVMFVLISFLIYYLANKAVSSTNKYSFLNIVVMNLFIKIMASFILIVIYVKMTEPTNKWYLISFMINYLIFTIFETYFLSKAAKVQ